MLFVFIIPEHLFIFKIYLKNEHNITHVICEV